MNSSYLEFLELFSCVDSSFIKFRMFLTIMSLNIPSVPCYLFCHSGTTIILCWYMRLSLTAPSDSVYFTSLFFFFLPLRMGALNSPIFCLFHYSACSNLLLNSSSEFFISLFVLFICKISVWFLLIIYLFIYMIVVIWWDLISLFFFSSLSIFKVIDLKYLPNKTNVWIYSWAVSINLFFFLWMNHTFLFLSMPHNIFVENWIFWIV